MQLYLSLTPCLMYEVAPKGSILRMHGGSSLQRPDLWSMTLRYNGEQATDKLSACWDIGFAPITPVDSRTLIRDQINLKALQVVLEQLRCSGDGRRTRRDVRESSFPLRSSTITDDGIRWEGISRCSHPGFR